MKADVLALKWSGLSYGEIAQRLGISKSYATQLAQPEADAKSAVLERAGNRCERCGSAKRLLFHHDGSPEKESFNLPEYIKLLCQGCHVRTHTVPRATAQRLANPAWRAAMEAQEQVHGKPIRQLILDLYAQYGTATQVAEALHITTQSLWLWRLRLNISDAEVELARLHPRAGAPDTTEES